MIFYHGTPITPDASAVVILNRRHGLVSYYTPAQINLVSEVCASFVLDNGAFSYWRKKEKPDWNGYVHFVQQWMHHPNMDFAIVPDVIGGTCKDNDDLLAWWLSKKFSTALSLPVWHMNEDLGRLEKLVGRYPRIGLGSTNEFPLQSKEWWLRMAAVFNKICTSDGYPKTKIHGLRMMDEAVVKHFPFSSADSTNVAQNLSDNRWGSERYRVPTKSARGIVIATRIENATATVKWLGRLPSFERTLF